MKVIVVVKNGGSGQGVSQATRYISQRERDEEREGKEARRLFSDQADDLGYRKANRLLGGGQEAATKDVLHLIISLANEKDFERLGEDEKSRQHAFHVITREAVQEMTRELGAQELRWVAGIHRNTNNPHVHLLLHRDYVERATGRTRSLQTLPQGLRVGWERTADGERVIQPGTLSQSVERLLDEHLAQTRETHAHSADSPSKETTQKSVELQQERLVLGRAWLAQDWLERLAQRHANLLEQGERKRYEIIAEDGQRRFLSERDVHERARRKAEQFSRSLPSYYPAATRQQIRETTLQRELEKQREMLDRIRTAHAAALQYSEAQTERAKLAAEPLLRAAAAIREKGDATTPLLTRAELAQLQEHAVRNGEAGRLRELETVRVALAQERAAPPRTEVEVGRLQAQLFVARARLAAERKSAADFEQTKHQRQWEFPRAGADERDEKTRDHLSLAALERALGLEKDQAKFIGERRVHWDDDKRAVASERAAALTAQRYSVWQQIGQRRTALAERIVRQTEVVRTLEEIQAKESQPNQAASRSLPAPRFTEEEFRELEFIAARRQEPEFTRTLIELERAHDAHRYPAERQPLAERVGRAKAREISAEITWREAAEKLERLTERCAQVDVLVRDDEAGEMKIARLADVAPRSPLERLFHPLLVRQKEYREVAAAVASYETKLTEQLARATENHAVLAVAARTVEQAFASAHPEQALPRSAFTAWELNQLKTRAMKEHDPQRQAHYTRLVNEAQQPARESAITQREHEPEFER